MNLRTSILVVLATALALALGLAGVVVVGKIAQSMRASVTSEMARQAFVRGWSPPRELSLDRLLPDRIGELSVTSRVSILRWTNVGVNLAAVRGVYVAPSGLTVEVIASQTRSETEALDRATVAGNLKARLEKQNGTKTFLQLNDRWQMSSQLPPEELDLWGLPGWLILFRSDREIPLPFTRTYLQKIAQPENSQDPNPSPSPSPSRG